MPEPNRILLDAYARRHEAQKIYLRQAAAQRWIEWWNTVLQGQEPNSSHRRQLRSCDERLRMVRTTTLPHRSNPLRHIVSVFPTRNPLPAYARQPSLNL